jgi:hypothetical protein
MVDEPHEEHAELDDWPASGLNLPVPQLMQDVEAEEEEEYFPIPQSEQ